MLRFSCFTSLSCIILALAPAAQAQPKTVKAAEPVRTLIVSGGPEVKYNQYAIESNARYVESLTARTTSQRVLFADGNRDSRTITAFDVAPDKKETTVLAVLLQEKAPQDKVVLNASALKRLDGASTPDSIISEVQNLSRSIQHGERGFIYFTGHGSPGKDARGRADIVNTHYNAWGKDLSVRELAPTLQSWPKDIPLTLVMVQCYGGGFANLLFENGDPQNPLWPGNVCGFFATSSDRVAAGCTPEVNERDYQDFTTYFFAALSGVKRDGGTVKAKDVDFDKDGVVSGLEALAYTDLYDDSIDVPICTSDIYLRSLWPNEEAWRQTPYSTLIKNATPWEKAVLEGLSREFDLSGEARIDAAFTAHDAVVRRMAQMRRGGNDADAGVTQAEGQALTTRLEKLKADLFQRFSALQAKDSPDYTMAKAQAVTYLKTRPKQVQDIYQSISNASSAMDRATAREAKLWRFVRMARTVTLQTRLQTEGTPEQKAVFARLRTNESRNFLK